MLDELCPDKLIILLGRSFIVIGRCYLAVIEPIHILQRMSTWWRKRSLDSSDGCHLLYNAHIIHIYSNRSKFEYGLTLFVCTGELVVYCKDIVHLPRLWSCTATSIQYLPYPVWFLSKHTHG